MFTTIIFIAVLSLLVFVHELGHFWTARRCGIKAEEFGFGFPPRAIGVYKDFSGRWKIARGSKEVHDAADTIYSLNWVPLGGFVRIKGENGDDESERDADSFSAHPIWQRTLVLLAGVTMNFILAAVLLSIGYMSGMPADVSNLQSDVKVEDRKVKIVSVMENTPAAQAKLQAGDTILSINGQAFERTDEVSAFVAKKEGQTLSYVVKRGENIETAEIAPQKLPNSETVGIGVGIAVIGMLHYPPHLAVWHGFRDAALNTWMIVVAFGALIVGLFTGSSMSAQLAGPVGIAGMAGDAARMGWTYLIQFTSMLSLNLAVLNALPIPALDGGRIIFLLIEKIKGGPVRKEIEGALHSIGFVLLIGLVILVTVRDVMHLF